MKTFYLIDGHAQIFRAYYAPFGQLSSPNGEPTKAVHVFTQMIFNILDEKKPDYIAVALDVGDDSTERKKIYPEYKENRDAAPEDFGPQVTRIVEILETLKIPIYAIKGYEADDIIATAARLLKDEDVELRIVSRDKDLHQVLSEKVLLWDPQVDKTLDGKSLVEEKGYTPEQAVEIQTLTGDSTDNIPGVPGIGPKKALTLITKYGTADAVFDHAEELTPKMKENVLASKDVLALSRQLVTLDQHVDFPFALEECARGRVTFDGLAPIFRELGFRRLYDGLAARTADPAEAPQPKRATGDYRQVDTESGLSDLVKSLEGIEAFAIDTETTGLHPIDAELVGLSFSWEAGVAYYVPVRSSKGKALDPQATLEALRPVLENPKVEKYGQNIKYDVIILRNAGVEVQGVAFDSMLASYLLYPDRRNHGMDALSRDFLDRDPVPISEIIGTGKKQISMLDAEPEALCNYAAEDADITWQLCQKFLPELKDPLLTDLFENVEMPLLGVLADMEFCGVALDKSHLKAYSAVLGERIDEIAEDIFQAAGREFTIDSPKQLAEVLFDELGFRVVKKTKTSRSTDAAVLQTLASESEHPLPKLVLEYRELTKLQGTYVKPLPTLVSENSGRIHAGFHQAVAATGRLSSSDPNLQNIPVRTEQGREIRRAFIPGSSDQVLLTADYSQIELRILAHLSRDENLITAFQEDQDIHAFVASQIYGASIEEVTSEQRSRAKAVNFGIIYGQGAFGLARSLNISRGEASEFIAEYKERYPGIVTFMNTCVQTALDEGSVQTMLGRRRPIPEINSRNRGLRAQGERLAINTVVQGSAADMIKIAMVRIHRRIRDENLPLQLLIQVHDELVFEADRGSVEELSQIVTKDMAEALPLDVPVRVDANWGENWLEGK
ncbi:MAG: DNA polymerase I [Planctomycetota bacterium]